MLYHSDLNPYLKWDDLKLMFNNKPEIRALEFIFKGCKFNMTEMSEIIRCSHYSAKRLINNFMAVGILKQIQKEDITLFKINRSSNIFVFIVKLLSHTKYNHKE